jgi:predicted metal-dependent hydrolase
VRKSVFVENDLPPVTLRVSNRARRMALRLDPSTRAVHLIVPARASLKRAYDFAREHAGWIDRRLAALPEPIPFEDGAALPIFGRLRRIRVCVDPSCRTTRIDLQEDFISVTIRREGVDVSGRLRRQMIRWAAQALEEMAGEKARRIEKTIGNVQVRDTKSRWGSCSPQGDLNFSWRLIFAPPAAMDYVVAHEIAHLSHMNHGLAFWALCRDLSDDFLVGRRWVRANGSGLMRYGATGYPEALTGKGDPLET